MTSEPTLYQRCAHHGNLAMQAIHNCDGYTPIHTFDGKTYIISGDFNSITDMIDALQDNRPTKIQQIETGNQ